MAEIVRLDEYRTTEAADRPTRPDESALSFKRQARANFDEEQPLRKAARETSIDDLFSSETLSSGRLARARQLLSQICDRVEKANLSIAEQDVLSSEEQISLIQADLPELFLLRDDLSEGFAAVILAIHYGLLNRGPKSVSSIQLLEMIAAFEMLREHLFLSFDEGMDIVDKLADAGFLTAPAESEFLGDVFAAQ